MVHLAGSGHVDEKHVVDGDGDAGDGFELDEIGAVKCRPVSYEPVVVPDKLQARRIGVRRSCDVS
jgi:hypothetical protein